MSLLYVTNFLQLRRCNLFLILISIIVEYLKIIAFIHKKYTGREKNVILIGLLHHDLTWF